MSAASTGAVQVRISPAIERDYKARDVFRELRITHDCRIEGAVTYRVPRALALRVRDDARAQHRRDFTVANRGTKKAYLELLRAVDASLSPPPVSPPRPSQPAREPFTPGTLAAQMDGACIEMLRRTERHMALDPRMQMPELQEMRLRILELIDERLADECGAAAESVAGQLLRRLGAASGRRL